MFAIYEPHHAGAVTSDLIGGATQAALFDTGMGISDIQKVAAELTALPIVVLNSHAHPDHVGGNRQFKDILGMDTDFTRASAKNPRIRGGFASQQDEGPRTRAAAAVKHRIAVGCGNVPECRGSAGRGRCSLQRMDPARTSRARLSHPARCRRRGG